MGFRSSTRRAQPPEAWVVLPTRTRISPQDFVGMFNLTAELYAEGVRQDVVAFSYRTVTAPDVPRLLHDATDCLHFAAILSLGWPVCPAKQIADQAFDICDHLCRAWEDCLTLPEPAGHGLSGWPVPMTRPAHSLVRALAACVLDLPDLHPLRREALLRHMLRIVHGLPASPPGGIPAAVPAGRTGRKPPEKPLRMMV